MTTYAQKLRDDANGVNEQMKELLERCQREGRTRTAEETTDYQRMSEDYDRLVRESNDVLAQEARNAEAATFREAFEPVLPREDDARRSMGQVSALERFFRTGDTTGLPVEREGRNSGVVVDYSAAARASQMIRAGADAAELRTIVTNPGVGSLIVPTTFSNQLYQYMEASSAIRSLSTVITTASGENISFPRVGTHAIGTQVIAQGTAIGGTDPVFELMTLSSFKFGELLQISHEGTTDAMFDIVGFIAQNVGRALGRITDTAYVTGNGTTAPGGIITTAGTGVKTGGTLIALTLENLIDLQHSVTAEYRSNATWVFNDSTAGTLRKIREDGGTSGAFLWQPAVRAGDDDLLLGSPVRTDGNFASQGSASRSVAYGDFSANYIRDAGGVRFERSDEFAFNTDLVSFRGVVRTDADLIDLNAVKTSSQSV